MQVEIESGRCAYLILPAAGSLRARQLLREGHRLGAHAEPGVLLAHAPGRRWQQHQEALAVQVGCWRGAVRGAVRMLRACAGLFG
eukprot:10692070-Alexandrium_andersonii.AAC.1